MHGGTPPRNRNHRTKRPPEVFENKENAKNIMASRFLELTGQLLTHMTSGKPEEFRDVNQNTIDAIVDPKKGAGKPEAIAACAGSFYVPSPFFSNIWCMDDHRRHVQLCQKQ